jgi:hypothetical protein
VLLVTFHHLNDFTLNYQAAFPSEGGAPAIGVFQEDVYPTKMADFAAVRPVTTYRSGGSSASRVPQPQDAGSD